MGTVHIPEKSAGCGGAAAELRWFDAPLPTTMLAERVARLLRGQPAAALRELLRVASKDHLSADEVSAVLAEPL